MYALWSEKTRQIVATGETLDSCYRSLPKEIQRDSLTIVDVDKELEKDKQKWKEQQRRNPNTSVNVQAYANNHGKTEKISSAYSGHAKFDVNGSSGSVIVKG